MQSVNAINYPAISAITTEKYFENPGLAFFLSERTLRPVIVSNREKKKTDLKMIGHFDGETAKRLNSFEKKMKKNIYSGFHQLFITFYALV